MAARSEARDCADSMRRDSAIPAAAFLASAAKAGDIAKGERK